MLIKMGSYDDPFLVTTLWHEDTSVPIWSPAVDLHPLDYPVVVDETDYLCTRTVTECSNLVARR